jgi:hypothetical protein
MMMLLDCFLEIFTGLRSVFAQERTYQRAIRQAVCSLICLGRRTLTRIIQTSGRENQNLSSEYFLHSRSPWSSQDIFKPIAKEALRYCSGKYLGVVGDDTSIPKTGSKIKQAFWQRDPMSPKFRFNLRLGIRFLQLALVLPLHKTQQAAARTIPICFNEATPVKRPRKSRKNYQEEMAQYRELRKTHNLSQYTLSSIEKIRKDLDQAGGSKKTMVFIGDGSFCNRTIFSYKTERVELMVRARKDAKLCKRSNSRKRFYDEKPFTPAEVFGDNSIAWKQTRLFYGGKRRAVRYKEVSLIFWRSGAKRRPLRLFVVAPTSYRLRKTGRLRYRQTSYFLTTILSGDVKELLQLYFDRWQIEVNHREEKDTIGLGQAQLHNFEAVIKQPALIVAAYSALHLAALKAYGPFRTNAYEPLPRWRSNATRPSCLDLLVLLRKQIVDKTQIQREMGTQITFQRLATIAAA